MSKVVSWEAYEDIAMSIINFNLGMPFEDAKKIVKDGEAEFVMRHGVLELRYYKTFG